MMFHLKPTAVIKRYHIPALTFFLFCTSIIIIAQSSVEMSVIYFHEKGRVNVGTALNILTPGIGTLFGIPFATSITDVELEAFFFNNNKQFISVHRGVGRGKKWIGLYNLDTRLPHQRALKEAIGDLNTKIMSDPKLQEPGSATIAPGPLCF